MGKEFKFNIDGGIYKTLLGAILSILQTIGFFILLWYYGQDLYNKQEPSMIINSNIKDYFPEATVNSSIFKFAFRYEDEDGYSIDDKGLFDSIFLVDDYKSENGTFNRTNSWQIKSEKCSIKHYDNETLNRLYLTDYDCIENNYTFGGAWGSVGFLKLPQLISYRCNNDTQSKYNVKCKTNV